MVVYCLRRVKGNGALVVYIIDNDRAYELHRLYFVEAPAAVMEPLIDLMQKAWRRTCYGCGKARGEVAGLKCPELQGMHEYRENSFLCGTAPVIHWQPTQPGEDQRSITPAQWIAEMMNSLRDEVADLAAAREFIRLASSINQDFWWENFSQLLTEDK